MSGLSSNHHRLAEQPASTTSSARSRSRSLAMWSILVLLVAAITEGMAAAVYHIVLVPNADFLLWTPNLDDVRRNWNDQTVPPDDELGWPPPAAATAPPRDSTGAKYNADFPEPGHACVSAYGDSFVWGEEVAIADGWIEQLARQLRCRVSNYGVSGYGTDQAYIRFRRNAEDEAPVVLLGIFSQDVMRNVNQYRGFMGFPLNPYWLKGRFALDANNALEWTPRPRLDANGFVRLHSDPAKIVPLDYLLPDTHYGPVTPSYTYALTLLRVALTARIQTRLTGRVSTSEFLSPTHSSGALQLTLAIVEAFAAEAERRGRHLLVVMLPGGSSFRERASFGQYEYSPLASELASRNVDVFDPAPGLLAALAGRDYCDLYAHPDICGKHFGLFGSSVLADVVMKELHHRGLIK